MIVQEVRPHERAFLIQYHEILKEFRNLIPWLLKWPQLALCTDPAIFSRELNRLSGQREEGITGFQLLFPDAGHSYAGGLLHLNRPPEFITPRRGIPDFSETSFISCLQICKPFRGKGLGNRLMKPALEAILEKHPRVWGVCDIELAPWYERLGAQIHPHSRNDRMRIVVWEKT